MTGRIHSYQSLGAVDGPGIRFVVFLQGCALRCVYCHNPDTWDFLGGEEVSAADVVAKIKRYTAYFGEEGGVTVSGGEPLLQAAFVTELFRLLQAEGIHTALDTSGMGDLILSTELLAHTDLVLCDLKFVTEEAYGKYTGGSLKKVLDFLSLCEETKTPFWVRQVIVPGLNDQPQDITALQSLLANFTMLQKIELLPFKKICLTKYSAMGIPFPLEDTPACDSATLARLQALLPTYGK